MNTLTRNQAAILSDLQKMPKKNRTETGLVKYALVGHYDCRSLHGLFTKGYLQHSEYGIRVSE